MKLTILKRSSAAAVAVMISLILVSVSSAQQTKASVEDVVNADVVAVASVDLTKVKLLQLSKWGAKLGLISEKEAGNLKFKLAAAQGIIGGLADSGVERISVLLRISDIETQSPLWVASVKDGKDTAEAKEALGELLDLLPLPPQVLLVKDGQVIGGPTQGEIDSLFKSKSTAHPQTGAAMEKARQHAVSLVVTGNQETRRVVREMFPNLPKPFSEATGELIAGKVTWGGLFIDLPPEVDVEVTFQTTDDESAEAVGRLADATIQYAVKNIPAKLADKFGEAILAKLLTEVTGSQVVVDGQAILADQSFIECVVSIANKQRGSQQQNNNLRQVVLGILNYESANGNFPPAAISSETGEPLLSWRVAILPYLDQNELYQQFHLDEPWDSPHNLPLAEKMPEVYANFGSASGVQSPKTTVQVPYGEGLLFEGKELTTFGDVSDGSSNTIAVVCTHPDNAVCWTKPADWEVDLANPWEGLKRDGDESVYVAFSDSSVQLIGPTTSNEDLAALLTRAGGEVVNLP